MLIIQILLFFVALLLSGFLILRGVMMTATSAVFSSRVMPTIGNGNNIGFDPEYPFNNVVNSFFPVDALVEYQDEENICNNETSQLISRYASFSSILEDPLTSEFMVLPIDGCTAINETDLDVTAHSNKILIVQRGGCTFVDKVMSLVNSDLNPKGIIVGNNEVQSGLITMYSSSFNEDGHTKIPIIFITFEGYEELKDLKNTDPKAKITISTASLGSLINLIFSMALSPPLLILSFYFLIKICQRFRKSQKSKENVKLVNSLPLYVYNINHLIPENKFKEYLKKTNQAEPKEIESHGNSNGSLTKNSSCTSSCLSLCGSTFLVNGVDVRSVSASLDLLVSGNDYYQTYKCSICLEHFKPFKSKILVLDCKHIYHQNCLSNWLIHFKKSCPLCNKTFKNNSQGLLEGEQVYFGTFDLEQQPQVGEVSELEDLEEGRDEDPQDENEYGGEDPHEEHDQRVQGDSNQPPAFEPSSIALTSDQYSFYSAVDRLLSRSLDEYLTPMVGSVASDNYHHEDTIDVTDEDDVHSTSSDITIDGYASPINR